MSLEHQMAAKVKDVKAMHEQALKSVKPGDQVTYVNEEGIGREAHVKSISGEKATLEVILPDGQLVEKSGVTYLDTTNTVKHEQGTTAGTSEVAAKVRTRKGGRRGKGEAAQKLSEDGRELDNNGNPIARDILKLRDSAVLYEDQEGPYWHV
jgi:hypothetical protein